jgi:hypothetical protein
LIHYQRKRGHIFFFAVELLTIAFADFLPLWVIFSYFTSQNIRIFHRLCGGMPIALLDKRLRIGIGQEDKMKTRALLSAVVISGILVVPHAAFSRDDDYNKGSGWSDRWNDNDVRHLQGRWYMNGDPNKPTDIHMNGRRLEATNENGKTTRLEMDRRGDVRASDWQGLRGDVKGNRIEWSNGSTWTRRPSDTIGAGRWNDRETRQLQGQWYVNGDPKKPAEINGDGRNLQARNENGQTSRLEVQRDGDIRALDWRGLHGDVKRDRIEWANGSTWTKSPEGLSRR